MRSDLITSSGCCVFRGIYGRCCVSVVRALDFVAVMERVAVTGECFVVLFLISK